MQKSSTCSFMWGDLTDDETKIKIEQAFKKKHAKNIEVLIYKKTSEIFNYFLGKVLLNF